MMPPRIRGRVGQADAPEDVKGKWFFEISMWTFDGETRAGDPLGPYGPFDSKKIAQKEMKAAIRVACESYEEKMGFEPSGKYLDMKNGGVMRKFEES